MTLSLHSRRLFWLELMALSCAGLFGILHHGWNDLTTLLIAPFVVAVTGAVWMFVVDKTPVEGRQWHLHGLAASLGLWAVWIALN